MNILGMVLDLSRPTPGRRSERSTEQECAANYNSGNACRRRAAGRFACGHGLCSTHAVGMDPVEGCGAFSQ